MPEFHNQITVCLTAADDLLIAKVKAYGLRRLSREHDISVGMLSLWIRGVRGCRLPSKL